jgi:hypothetical protein
MGLFSKKKKIIVSSVAYNLAGPQENRVQYLPTTVVGKILSGNNFSMGDVINTSMLTGPGIRLRSFARWARTQGYTAQVGQTASKLSVGDSIDVPILTTQLPQIVGSEINIQTSEIGVAEYGFWADQWMSINHPDQITGDYVIDFNEVTNTVTLTFVGGPVYSFQPVGFDPLKQYLYASYNYAGPGIAAPVQVGPIVPVGSPAGYPDTSSWQFKGATNTTADVILQTKVDTQTTYSDSRPAVIGSSTSSTTQSVTTLSSEYERTTYTGKSPGANTVKSLKETQYNMDTKVRVSTPVVVTTTADIGGGVIATTKTTTTTDTLLATLAYQLNSQVMSDKEWSPMKVFIYQRGSGNTILDAMFVSDDDSGAFFPFSPIRQYNSMISTTNRPDIYKANKKAIKKATGGKYDEIVKGLQTSPGLKDIDHGFLVHGVSLNTKEKAARKYLYKFFQFVFANGAGGTDEFNTWKIQWNLANQSKLNWKSWFDAQGNSGSPLFGNPEPTVIPYPAMPMRSLRVSSGAFNYNMSLDWSALSETVLPGLGKVGAKVGDVWLSVGATENYDEILHTAGIYDDRSTAVGLVTITWQDKLDSHRVMSIWNMRHGNLVYKGKSVVHTAWEALGETEESGFIVPLHEGIFREMSIKDATQMSTACTYMVLNCYTVVKQKWYQTTLFKIVIIIIIIVVSIFFPPAGGAGAGLLGTAAAVGASLGFVGMAAVIVGAIANALAAMLLSMLIMKASTALFGDKVGAIVGTIASIAAVSYGSGVSSGQGFSASYGDMMSAQNIMKLSVAAGDGYTGYLKADAQETVTKSLKVMEDFAAKSKEISTMYAQNIGPIGTTFNPIELTDSVKLFPETPNMFLSRTLLTGSDIAGMTNDMIGNFVSVTTSTQLT